MGLAWICGALHHPNEALPTAPPPGSGIHRQQYSRRFAIVVQLHAAGALLGKKRRHLLRLAVLHGSEEPLIVLVPLVDL